MIQILGLRDYHCSKENRTKKAERFFDKGWRANSVRELFANLEVYIEQIPERERFNLYYTAGRCLEVKGRVLESQDIIPIDIDDIDLTQINIYVDVVLNHLDLNLEDVAVVATGNGLQFIIGTTAKIEYEEYFDENKKYYRAFCGNIATALFNAGLVGNVDTTVFSKGRLLRLPLTKNIKPKKGEKYATFIQRNITHTDFDLIKFSGIPTVEFDDQMCGSMLDRLPPPDTEGVLAGCDFIRWCGENPTQVSEPQWYALLSIIGRLENGMELAKQFSEGHPQYNEQQTLTKTEQAVEASGPRTCDNIRSMFDGCLSCINYGKCNSPIQLETEEFIKTKQHGFYEVSMTKEGAIKKGKPNYDDLMKHFRNQNPFACTDTGRMIYIHNGTHWEDYSYPKVESFAEEWFDPKPIASMCNEFKAKILRNNLINLDWFEVEGMMNMANGVLDLETMQLTKHSEKHGFRYVLPFDYDPDATCPVFDTILEKVSCGDSQIQTLLLEYMAYSVSGMDAAIGQKALILTGEGSNGKSVFLDILKHLVGKLNYCTLSMGSELNKLENRYQLEGKLFNISEETPTNSMVDGSIFKALVTGGEVQARKLYSDSYSMKNNAKIIMACNELPPTQDATHGMFRRLLIVPFNAVFSKDDVDYDPMIKQKAMAEAAGIFNKVMAVLPALQERKYFSESKAVNASIEEYKEDNDFITNWWSDTIVYDEDTTLELTSNIAYMLYAATAHSSGVKPATVTKFRRVISKAVPDDRRTRLRRDGIRQLVFLGYRAGEKKDD